MVEGGGCLSKLPALATADGQYLIVPVSECIRLYGVASGTLATVLKGHTADITAVTLNTRNDAQVRRLTEWEGALSGIMTIS